ncbi:MAG: aspartate aminotransferase family protein [Bacillota bacterium]
MSKNAEMLARAGKTLMGNVSRFPVVFSKGRGSSLYDVDGKEYLDFLTGISVESLGHGNPYLTKAIQEQADKLLHVSNYFYTEEQIIAGEMLCDYAGMDKVFFCNSGAEANEAAIKLARKYGREKLGGRFEIITAYRSFHGRTLGALAATGQPRYHEAFRPLPEGFAYADFNNIKTWRDRISDRTCALMVEPVQGEGGVYPATESFMHGLKELCEGKKLLLIFDEVQTGMARTGKPFAWQHWGVRPDILTTGKSLGGGIPIGAMMCTDECDFFTPGDHSTTIGGGGAAWAAAIEVINQLKEHALAQRAWKLGETFKAVFHQWREELRVIKEIRGMGLMLAVELTVPAKPVARQCLEQGLIVNAVSENAIRMLPPLLLSEKEMKDGLGILYGVLKEQQEMKRGGSNK